MPKQLSPGTPMSEASMCRLKHHMSTIRLVRVIIAFCAVTIRVKGVSIRAQFYLCHDVAFTGCHSFSTSSPRKPRRPSASPSLCGRHGALLSTARTARVLAHPQLVVPSNRTYGCSVVLSCMRGRCGGTACLWLPLDAAASLGMVPLPAPPRASCCRCVSGHSRAAGSVFDVGSCACMRCDGVWWVQMDGESANLAKGVTVRDVNAAAFIKAYAAHLKNDTNMRLPKWHDVVKTGVGRELAPYDEDWYYVRAGTCRRVMPCWGASGRQSQLALAVAVSPVLHRPARPPAACACLVIGG